MTITPFIPAEYLTEVETARAYLVAVFEDGEIEEVCAAVDDVAIAFGLLDDGPSMLATPTLDTFLKVLDMVGAKVSVSATPGV